MRVFLHHGDLLSIPGVDSIALPVDGRGPGLEGSVAHQLLRLFEAESLNDLYEVEPDYPFNGRAHWSQLAPRQGLAFQWVCALGTGIRSSSGIDGAGGGRAVYKQTARAAFADMIRQSSSGNLGTRIACPVLSGGGRIPTVEAALMMLDETTHWSQSELEVHIVEHNADHFALLRPYFD